MDEFQSQLTPIRAALLRTALARLRNRAWAEDAVSETLLAALEKQPAFCDPPRVRAWLFGILRHKIVDQLRRQLGDDVGMTELDVHDADAPALADDGPHGDPLRRAMDRQFLLALAHQLERLPALQARALFLADCWGSGTAEVCGALDVSSGHLWVLLHRARQRLRLALDEHRV